MPLNKQDYVNRVKDLYNASKLCQATKMQHDVLDECHKDLLVLIDNYFNSSLFGESDK